tara:strand:+ start:729 stop:1430 length:702 start_codon:yes stop_codon:yes gene_type:complete
VKLPDKVIKAIEAHAAECYPRECCGLVIIRKGRPHYFPCRNVARQGDFAIHPEDYAAAEDAGAVAMVVHSHPNISPLPSQSDLIGCERSGLPWLIMNWPTGQTHQFEPSGYQADLYGRQFHHGVLDCYSFIRDYYKQVLQIDIPDFKRDYNWWIAGQDLYREGFASAGFHVVDTVQEHDVLLLRVASPVPNHGAVYLGGNIIGHHQVNRLSSRDIYGGLYQKSTTHILRHHLV